MCTDLNIIGRHFERPKKSFGDVRWIKEDGVAGNFAGHPCIFLPFSFDYVQYVQRLGNRV